jgi:single-strand selective monofunctional uracil DNA glycosylase
MKQKPAATRSLVDTSRALSREVSALSFAPPTTHVYNPLDYARIPAESYLTRYGEGEKEALFLGMNPGPFGMAQTGVPFGDIAMVRDFLGLAGAVTKPKVEHPKRRIEGFACTRSEVSGTRLWGFVKERFEDPARFFARFFVWNYCPLVFMEASGANRTPDKLPKDEQGPLFAACDEALRHVTLTLGVKQVIGVGAFAAGRAREALDGLPVRVGTVLHPSPASPRANRGWANEAAKDLEALGIRVP